MLFYYHEFAGVEYIVYLKSIEIETVAYVAAVIGGFISRKCQRSNEIVNFDNFTYEYDGNKLIRVRESIKGQNDLKDFPYYNPDGASPSFLYDPNGNLTMDVARNLSITYNNWLDLPASILYETGRLAYTYGRNGLKIAKKAYNKYNQITLDEQYFGDLVTNRGIPVRILHEDGYIELSSQMSLTFYYYLTDHLGNVRVVFTPNIDNTPAFVQANNYYPFGMAYSKNLPVQGGSGTTTTTTYVNKFLYNGKEEQDMPGKWLDYGARFYDPQVGRWHSVDPMAEVARRWSPYTYSYNNSIRFIDPDGMAVTEFGVTTEGKVKQIGPTDNNPDRLYKMNDKGEKVGNELLTLTDKSILPSLSKEKQSVQREDAEGTVTHKGTLRTASSNNREDMTSLFLSLAKNTEVEWSMFFAKNGETSLGTYQWDDLSPGLSSHGFKSSSVSAMIHNHPNPKGLDNEKSSLYGDRGLAKSSEYKYFTYMSHSGNVFRLDTPKILLTPSVNNMSKLLQLIDR